MFDVQAVQQALKEQRLDGWLLYDFRGLNVLARRVLDMAPDRMMSRRWFYFIPASGEPRKLVHRIEPHALDHLPGEASRYLRWQELEEEVRQLVGGAKRLAMEYVPRNANPYISRVDAGTIELVRFCGPEIVSSGDLIQVFEACWDDEQWAMHRESAEKVGNALEEAFYFLARRLRGGGAAHELEVQKRILEHFERAGLVCDHAPVCAVGPHSGDPHYEPGPGDAGLIREGDFVLIDLWAKLDRPRAVYSDYTWTCFVGEQVPEKYTAIFRHVAAARDAAIETVRAAFAANRPLQGWEVDAAARGVIEKAGYGENFCHRTGHSIGQEVHGNGANMDGLETREERRVLRRTCFSVEPGIYFPEFGIRSETDVFVDGDGKVHVTGPQLQTEVVPLLARYR